MQLPAIPDGLTDAFITHLALLRDDFACQSCGRTGIPGGSPYDLTVHHIIPRLQGGATILSNLVTLCWRCHRIREHNRRIEDGVMRTPHRRQVVPEGTDAPTSVAQHLRPGCKRSTPRTYSLSCYAGPTGDAIAKALGVSRQTVYSWRRHDLIPHFNTSEELDAFARSEGRRYARPGCKLP